jgi:hypothetical protein
MNFYNDEATELAALILTVEESKNIYLFCCRGKRFLTRFCQELQELFIA